MNKPFLYKVVTDIQKKFGKELSDIAIVFNNKRPITYFKKYLSDVYNQALWSPEFYTISEFFESESQEIVADDISQFFHLYRCYNNILKKEGRKEETFEEFYPLAEIILSDFAELDYELVSVDRVFDILYDTTKIDLEFDAHSEEQKNFLKTFWSTFQSEDHSYVQQRFLKLWKRLPLLYKEFKRSLLKDGATTLASIYRNIAEKEHAGDKYINRFSKIIFIGFNALNNAEKTIFKRWQDQNLALFYFDVDPYYMEDPNQEAGHFLRQNIAQTGLKNSLEDSPGLIKNKQEPIKLYGSGGMTAQAKLLSKHLETNYHVSQEKSTGILLADEQLLLPLLQSLPDIPVNITTGYPFSQSPIFSLLSLWMDIQHEISINQKDKLPYDWLKNLLSNPFSGITQEEKDLFFKEVSKKQNYEIDISELKLSNAVLSHFFKPINQAKDLIPGASLLLDTLLEQEKANHNARRLEIILIVEAKKALNKLFLGFSNTLFPTIDFQRGLIKRALSSVKAAIQGDPTYGVQIMGLLESRSLNFDSLYVLGANEGVLPKSSPRTTFIPFSIRQAFGLSLPENQQALSAYLFFRQIQHAKEINVYYNSLVNYSGTGEESRFIKQLEYEARLKVIRYQHAQPIYFKKPSIPLAIEKDKDVLNKLQNKYLKAQNTLSASALTTYLNSPLEFFIKYVAEIKEPPTISQEIEANKLGTIIHNVMERILTPFLGLEDFSSTQELKLLKSKVSQHVVQEIGIQHYKNYTKLNELSALEHIMHKIACSYISTFLDYDIKNYEFFKIIELENNEDYILDFPIVVNGKEEIIKLFGIIDRVDQVVTHDGELINRIVDYKTGGDELNFKIEDSLKLTCPKNKALIQTLFYTYIYQKIKNANDYQPHLYVARTMQSEGTLFYTGSGKKKRFLDTTLIQELKDQFEDFLRMSIEQIFDCESPFIHHPESIVYPNSPYEYLLQSTESAKLDEE